MPTTSTLERGVRWANANAYRLGVGAIAAALAAFLLAQGMRWPPHEDETLVFFISRQPLNDLLATVFGDRGGAPLHFLLAHAVAGWWGLSGLRLISVVFAVASVPVIAALAARLTDRRTALVATASAAASWMVVYHGIYARMYALFLFTSALSFLLLLRALERRGARAWIAWGLVTLAAIATQPYGAFVLAISAVFVVFARRWMHVRVRPALVAIGVVTLLAVPLWVAYSVLADRFNIGVAGTSGSRLGSPVYVLEYLWRVVADFTVGWTATVPLVLALAAIGLVGLARTRPPAAVLAGAVFGLPTIAFLVTRSGTSVSLESRHVIFALPFFALVVAVGLVRLAAVARRWAPAVLVAGVALLLAGEIAWGAHRTPWMYGGEPRVRTDAREAAAAWLAATSRPDDVLFGYEPTYLDAWEEGAPFGAVIVPRADPGLALETLAEAPKPLGRGVWLFDGSDILDADKQRFTLPAIHPGAQFETRSFGPFLIVRTTEPVRDAETFLRNTAVVEYYGKLLAIGDAGLNYSTAVAALARLQGRG